MGNSLQQLRQNAGFRSAREFASACGFTPSSMGRYEKDPENIPVKSAWKIADFLGCTIDDVVGRESAVTADLRGEVQVRYDALPPSRRRSLDEYLEFLETRKGADEACRDELEGCYMDMFKAYLVMFLEGMGGEEKGQALLNGGSDEMREQFQGFLYAKVIEKSETFADGGEVIEGVMRAYDKFYPKPRPSLGL